MATTRTLADDVAALAARPKTAGTLPAAQGVAPIPPRVGTPRGATGSGITSPLTETAYSDRTFHPPRVLTVASGWFQFEVRDIQTMKFKDGDGNPLTLNFSERKA